VQADLESLRPERHLSLACGRCCHPTPLPQLARRLTAAELRLLAYLQTHLTCIVDEGG
jgi:hypothetical protein